MSGLAPADQHVVAGAAVQHVDAGATQQQVVAVAAQQRVVAGPAVQGRVDVGGDDLVVAVAADALVDDGSEGDGDVVLHPVGARERAGIEVEERVRREARQVERVVAAVLPDRDDRMLVDVEVVVAGDRTLDVAVETEGVVAAGERAAGCRAVQALHRQDVDHHRSERVVAIPLGAGHRVLAGMERGLLRADVRHQRPQLHVVGPELLDPRVHVEVVGPAMAEPEHVAKLVHQRHRGETLSALEAGDVPRVTRGVDRDEVPGVAARQ